MDYRKLYELLPLPVIIVIKKQEEFRIQDSNQSFKDLISHTQNDIRGKEIAEVLTAPLDFSPDKIKYLITSLKSSVTKGLPAQIDLNGKLNKDCSEEDNWKLELIPFPEDKDSPRSIMIVFREPSKAAKSRVNENHRFHSIFQNSPDAMLFTVPGGQITGANAEACKMLQMTEEELCLAGIKGIMDADGSRISEILSPRAKVVNSKEALTCKRKDDSKFPVEVTSSVFENSYGEDRAIIIIRDLSQQRKIEEDLKKTNEKYSLIFEHNPLPNWIYENETLRITDVNQVAIEEYGYSREEFLQKKLSDLFTEEDIPGLLAEIENKKSKKGVSNYGKIRHLRKDGSIKISDVWTYRISKSNKTLVIVQDISKWEEIQNELRQKSEKLIAAEKIGRLGYWELDFINNQHFWTDQVYEIWERCKGDFKLGQQSFYETIYPDDLQELKEVELLAFSGKIKLDHKHRIILPGGGIKWVHQKGHVVRDATGTIIGVQGSVQDITEYKTAVDKLRTSEARQASLLKSQTSYLVRTDLSGNYTYCNEKFYNDFEWLFSEGEILGHHAFTTFKDYHHEKVKAVFEQCVQNPNKVFQVEIDKIKRDNEIKSTLWDLTCLTNAKGQPIEIQAVGIDITNRVKAEEELIDAKRRYELVLKATSDAIWDWNAKSNTLLWGQGFQELFGYDTTKDVPAADFWHKYIHPEDTTSVLKKLNAVLESDEDHWEGEYRFIKANGAYAYVRDRSYILRNKEGKPVRMVGAMQDITDEKLRIKELVRSEALYKSLLQSQTNYFLRIDTDGNYSFCNDKFKRDFGWLFENEAVIGSHSLSSIANYHHQRVRETTQKCIDHPYEVFKVELDKPRESGGMRKSLWDFSFLPNSDNGKAEVQCIGIDITDRVEAEKEIKFQAKLLNTIGQSVIATDTEGSITYWNQAAEKIYGWRNKQVIGANIRNITPSSKSLKQSEGIMKKLYNGQSWSGEFMVKRKGGSEFPAYVNTSPVIDEKGELMGIIGISSDITERKRLEELLEKAINLSRIGSYEIDCKTKEVYWSSMTKKIHGVEENYVPEFDAVFSFYNETERRKILEAYSEAFKNNIEFDLETQLLTKEGEWRWIRLIGQPEFENGECIKVSGSYQDIDKVKKAELEVLKASEEKEKILESIGDAFFTLNHQWIVTYWNSEAEKILQCPKEKILGEKLVDFFDIEGTAFEHYYRKATEENKIQHFESFFEGTQSWYEVNAYPSADGLSVFFKDVTDQKETNFKLKELNKNLQVYTNDLVTANKGLEQFSYIISHNLRAPVANILGLADLLKNDDYPQEVREEMLERLVGDVNRLDQVMYDLNQILQVKNEFSQNREPIKLQELVLSIKLSLKNLVEKEKVEIYTDFSACEQVMTIPGYLYSIFYNLIFNSIKYRRADINPVIQIESKLIEDKLIFQFKDNGLGMDLQKWSDQIFGLYKRFHHHVEGKGMGLFMVKTQVEILGGEISVASELESGTVFTIQWNAENMEQ